MSKQQIERLATLSDPTEARDFALHLLATSTAREVVDKALLVLAHSTLDESHRAVLRRRVLFYFDEPRRDSGGLIRAAIVRLLVSIDHPDDRDIYLRAIETIEISGGWDKVQNLRAAALLGLTSIAPDIAPYYAAKLLVDVVNASPFNGEPALTAIDILVKQGAHLSVYQFLLSHGLRAVPEVTGQAMERLSADFPPILYAQLVEQFIREKAAVPLSGAVGYITQNRIVALYPMVERIIKESEDLNLTRYALLAIAASRDAELEAMLERCATFSDKQHIPLYIEALQLSVSPRRDTLISTLQNRRK